MATTEKVALWPVVTVSLAGWVTIARGVIPVPLSETLREVFDASLAMLRLPVALPALAGAN